MTTDTRLKLLLTSAGVSNASMRQALGDLLGRPIEDCRVLCVPTAIHALPDSTGDVWAFLQAASEMGWHEIGVLELTALPSLPRDHWLPALAAADALYVCGGNTGYLSYWMDRSELFDVLPGLLPDLVYIGASAGSMMVTPGLNVDRDHLAATGIYYDDEFDEAAPPGAGLDRSLPLVDFVIRPHLGADYFPDATLENIARWATKVDGPLYAIDDETAIVVHDGTVRVVSEGTWQLFGS